MTPKANEAAERLAKQALFWREDGNPPAYDASLLGSFQCADDLRTVLSDLTSARAEIARLREAVELGVAAIEPMSLTPTGQAVLDAMRAALNPETTYEG